MPNDILHIILSEHTRRRTDGSVDDLDWYQDSMRQVPSSTTRVFKDYILSSQAFEIPASRR